MKRKLLTLQFIENGLIILYQEQLSKYELQSVNNYQIINKDTFIDEINKIIQTNKINNNILTDNINIIIDNTYTELYLSYLKEIFKELSFNKLEYIKQEEILKPKSNEIIVDISKNNIKLLTRYETIHSNIYYNKHKQILIIYIKNIIKRNNIQCIYLYGNNKYINKLSKEIENICKIKTYIYTHPDLIPISFLI